MSAEQLSLIAGILLSLGFSYVPGLNAKFASLAGETKRLIMLGLLLVVSGAVFGLSCANIFPTVSCDQAGALGLVEVFVLAAIANQTAFMLSPQSETAQAAKAKG
jgi:hypothetical protein